MTSRQLVYDTLNFKNPERAPRDIWYLPWVEQNIPGAMSKFFELYPIDITGCPAVRKIPLIERGNPYEAGESTDMWGCRFTNIQRGLFGEMKHPLVVSDDWSDISAVHFPEELLSADTDKINEFCKNTDKFVTGGDNPRPFECLQFIRGSQQLYMDLAYPPKKMLDFLERTHDLYCRVFTMWAKTDVDALYFSDDWGSQRSLLINPKTWLEIFAPLYRDYIDIAHKYGKKVFMHTDGFTEDIFPHLVDMGLDAINSQIFCMDIKKLAQYKGKITFWGEIDRQNLLPYGSTEDIKNAVRSVYENLWHQGGCIAQCEFTAGSKPENVHEIYRTWDELTSRWL